MGGDQGDRQSVRIPCLPQQGTGFDRIEGIGRQGGIIPERIDGEQRRHDHPIAFGGVLDQVFPIDGQIDRLAQPHIAPRAPRFPHVELAEHVSQVVPVFHHLGKGTLRPPAASPAGSAH